MTCARCGNDVRPGSAFCTQCGSPFAVAVPPPTMPKEPLVPTTVPSAPALSGAWLPVLIASGTAIILAGMVLAFLMHRSSAPAQAAGPVEPAGATVTATSTVIAIVTKTPPTTEVIAGGQQRPGDWPLYEYTGPSTYDVCSTPSYPLADPIPVGTMPTPGTDQYFTLLSTQAALRALNYGSPQLVVADGQFAQDTATAIAGFQQRHKVPITSQIDAATWAALNSAAHYWIGTCP